MKNKIDGYKVYITAIITFLTGIASIMNTFSTGEGDLMIGVQTILASLTIAGFRSTANKFLDK